MGIRTVARDSAKPRNSLMWNLLPQLCGRCIFQVVRVLLNYSGRNR